MHETKWNVYHYTDLNAMINILSKDKIVLRATNVLYLNAPHELFEITWYIAAFSTIITFTRINDRKLLPIHN